MKVHGIAGQISLALLALILTACGSDSSRNERLLQSLPKFPGAVEYERRTYHDDLGTAALEVAFQTPEGTTNADIIAFFVAELKDDWCYETASNYHYEHGELVDGQGLDAVFQGHGSTILLSTHHAQTGREVFMMDLGPTYERDPDINDCDL